MGGEEEREGSVLSLGGKMLGGMGLSPGFECCSLYLKGWWGERARGETEGLESVLWGEELGSSQQGLSTLSTSYVSGPGLYASDALLHFTFTKE